MTILLRGAAQDILPDSEESLVSADLPVVTSTEATLDYQIDETIDSLQTRINKLQENQNNKLRIETERRELKTRFNNSPHIDNKINIVIVGGGITGLSALESVIAEAIKESPNLKMDINISWIDATGDWGRGLPYRKQDNPKDDGVVILNQDVGRMSPIHAAPNYIEHALNSSDPDTRYTSADFLARDHYGDITEALADELCRKGKHQINGIKINVNKIAARVDVLEDIDEYAGGAFLSNGQLVPYDSIILSLGHSVSTYFPEFQKSHQYIGEPYRAAPHRTALHQLDLMNGTRENVKIALVGGDSSAMDSIRIMEHIGYRGRYYVIHPQSLSDTPEPHPLDGPWRYVPQLYTDTTMSRFKSIKIDKPSLLYPAAGSSTVDELSQMTLQELGKALSDEIKTAQAHGFGEGHVYYTMDLKRLHREAEDGGMMSNDFARFIHFIEYKQGALMPPSSFQIRQKLLEDNRLEFVRGRVNPSQSIIDHYHQGGDLFRLSVDTVYGEGLRLDVDLFSDCCRIQKGRAAPHHVKLIMQAQGLNDQAIRKGKVEEPAAAHLIGQLSRLKDDVKRLGIETDRYLAARAGKSAFTRARVRSDARFINQQIQYNHRLFSGDSDFWQSLNPLQGQQEKFLRIP